VKSDEMSAKQEAGAPQFADMQLTMKEGKVSTVGLGTTGGKSTESILNDLRNPWLTTE
jgi:hypothetical protein